MSLVNRMLVDLDRRLNQTQERPVPLAGLSVAAGHYTAGYWRWIATILGGLLVGVLVVAVWLWQSFSTSPPTRPLPPVVTSPLPAPPPVVAPPPPVVSVARPPASPPQPAPSPASPPAHPSAADLPEINQPVSPPVVTRKSEKAEKAEKIKKTEKVETKVSDKPVQNLQDTYNRALLALRQKDLPGAESGFRAVLAAAPAHQEARGALASLLIANGRTGEALPLLQAGLALAPGQAAFAVPYARLLVDRGHEAEALAALKAADTGTADPGYWGLRAAVEARLGRPAEAVESYRQALARQPGQGAWWVGLGLNLEAQGQNQAAQEAWRRAAALPGLDAALQRFLAGRLDVVTPPRQTSQPAASAPQHPPAASRQTSPSDWFR